MNNQLTITVKLNTTEFREYNSDVGRWWTPDPVIHDWESPYAGFGNNPNVFSDPRGLEVEVGGNTDFAENTMVKGLVDPQYQDRVTFCDNIASFDITALDAGLSDEKMKPLDSNNCTSSRGFIKQILRFDGQFLLQGQCLDITELHLSNFRELR